MKKLTLACCLFSSTALLVGCGFNTVSRTAYAPAAYTVGAAKTGVKAAKTVAADGVYTVGSTARVLTSGVSYGYPAYYWNTGHYKSDHEGQRYYYAGGKYYQKGKTIVVKPQSSKYHIKSYYNR